MTADPERLLGHVIRVGKVGTVISGATLAGYVTIGAALLISGYTIRTYPVLSFAHDPILNGLLAAIGFSTTVMSGGLFFLARLSRNDDGDSPIVMLLSALGVGFGSSVVRYTLPVAMKYVTNW
jgi:hypothetical protein